MSMQSFAQRVNTGLLCISAILLLVNLNVLPVVHSCSTIQICKAVCLIVVNQVYEQLTVLNDCSAKLD